MLLVASAPPSSPIGVDIEGVPSTVFSGFDDYVLAPGESAAGCADTDRKRLELWVAKEAALKTTGHGLSVEPHKLEVVRTGDEVSAVDVTDVWTSAISAPEHAELDRLNLTSVPCRPSHAAALSCADRLPVTSLKLTDLLSG
nr:4'-phosphopantetheinyl transferase superfamily protein [Brevibacterium marinum]